MQLIEQVAGIFRNAGEDQECYLAGADDTARAAIAAVFDWLADDPDWIGLQAGLDCGMDQGPETYWDAMLAAKRKEALSDD